jgi:transposase
VAAHEFALAQLLEELHAVLAQLATVESAMAASLKRVPYGKRLLTVPGLGVVSVATLVGELGDLRDYRAARQVIKMVGLDLVEDSSGAKHGHRHISRRGRRYARQMLYMVALKAGSGALKARRDRLVGNGKPPKKAIVANMCALLHIMFALARDDADFDPSLHSTPEVRKAS